MRFGLTTLSLSLSLFALSACGSELTSSELAEFEADTKSGYTAELTVAFDNLPALGPKANYEGWLIVDGAPVSAGVFDVRDGDTYHEETFELDADDVANAEMYVLTIEPRIDMDPDPSDTHVLAGAFDGDEADVTVDHEAALNTDFADAEGAYIMDTPTSRGLPDYRQGVWFLDPDLGPGASLVLPELPAGWTYEGWVVVDGEPLSTGTFDAVDDFDSDEGGRTAGRQDSPPFPGQDFIRYGGVELVGAKVAITAEPVPDNSGRPYGILPLLDEEATDEGRGGYQTMETTPENVPTGTISR